MFPAWRRIAQSDSIAAQQVGLKHCSLPNRVEFSILDEGYQRARWILEEKRSILETLARLLPEEEVVSGKEIQKLVHKQEQMQ